MLRGLLQLIANTLKYLCTFWLAGICIDFTLGWAVDRDFSVHNLQIKLYRQNAFNLDTLSYIKSWSKVKQQNKVPDSYTARQQTKQILERQK